MPKSTNDKHLTSRQLTAFALPALGFSLATVPVYIVLPTLYVQHAQISLTAIGSIVLFRSIYDAVSDQVIGYFSDRTRSRLGARLPWIIAGSIITLVSVVYLFRIPADAGIWYFGFWNFVFFTGSTMFSIPHLAWGHELSPHYEDRNRVFAYISFAGNSGNFLFSLIPIFLVSLGLWSNTEYDQSSLWVLGLVLLILIPASVTISSTFSPRKTTAEKPRTNLVNLIQSVRTNKPFLRFILVYIIVGTGYGFFLALLYPFISTYLLIPEAFATIFMVISVAALVSIPIWIKIIAKLGKHRAWAWGWIANSLVLIPFLWVEPGPSAIIPSCILMALYALTNGVGTIAPFAILSDVIDYDTMKTGIDRGGNYYAFMTFAVKAMMGSTGGLALILLGAVFSYQLEEGANNTAFANLGILVMFIAAPGVFQLAALPLIWNFPIDARRHKIIRRRLSMREARGL